ncbi:MAG: FkbM family methyltransferase [Mariniphaga sp.]
MQHSEILSLLNEKKIEISYSQYQEDLLFIYIFGKLGIEFPSYLDIGAHHPTKLSNTALLYERGCSGINVEANPYLITDFEKYRPRDCNLNLGIGLVEGQMKFYLIKDSPALSTFEESQIERLAQVGKTVEKVIKVDVVRIESIIEKYCDGKFPDFLTIDAEGGDYGILKSINFNNYRPKLICVEINSHGQLLRSLDIEFLLFSNRYFHFGDIGGGLEGRNSLFIDIQFLPKLL